MSLLPDLQIIVALGRIAFENILHLFGIRDPQYVFSHGALYSLSPVSTLRSPLTLIASYHPVSEHSDRSPHPGHVRCDLECGDSSAALNVGAVSTKSS